MHKFIPCVCVFVYVSVCVCVCVGQSRGASWLTETRVRYFLPPHLFVLTVALSPLLPPDDDDDDDFASKTIKFHLKNKKLRISAAKTIYILRITWLK